MPYTFPILRVDFIPVYYAYIQKQKVLHTFKYVLCGNTPYKLSHVQPNSNTRTVYTFPSLTYTCYVAASQKFKIRGYMKLT